MTLRTRLAIISAVAVALVVVIAVVVAQRVARAELLREIDQSLVDRAAVFDRLPDLDSRELRAIERLGPGSPLGRSFRSFDALYVQVITRDGTVVAPRGQVALPVGDAELALAVGSGRRRLIRSVDVEDTRLRMITTGFPGGGAVQVARSLDEFESTLRGVTGTLTVAGFFGVALAALLGLAVARSALRPVDRLTKTVEHVAATKELAARIEVERDDEVGRLARSFNAMLEALEESRIQQQRLVRDAGHELRTPLTALRTNIELLARADTMSPTQRRELLDAATAELVELTDLAAELVDLAADPDVVTEPVQTVQLDELTERVVERYRRRTGREIVLEMAPTPGRVRPAAVERAIGNLVDNAHKWSPPGAPIVVRVGGGRITVSDRGPGIAAEDRPLVFERFYRAPNARSTTGSGLGLAIVKKIVEEHGGAVLVEDTAGGGATVGFTLPPP